MRIAVDRRDQVHGAQMLVADADGGPRSELLLDFERPVTLRDGDGLVLDDGSIVVVAGQAERLVEVSAKGSLDFVRRAARLSERVADG